MNALLTIGYQDTVSDALIRHLVENGARCVIDVRQIPQSRKPGFSKRTLAASLAANGIGYLHLPGLGTPKPGREAARRGDRAGLEAIYEAHLTTGTAVDALGHALARAAEETSCLLCFERDPTCCHRRIVADRLGERRRFAIRHLVPPSTGLRDHDRT